MTLVNTFEGGTDGTTLTGGSGGNTGGASGDFFNAVSIAAGGTLAFSTTQKKSGALSLQVATAGTAAATSVQWSLASHGALVDDYVRAYYYCTNLRTVNGTEIRWWSAALTSMGGLSWTTTGAWAVQNAAGTTVATSSTTIPAGEWCRIEAHKHVDTTAGFITCRIFKGANLEGTTADEEFGTANTWVDPDTTAPRVDFGMAASGGINQPGGGSFFLDDIAAGGTTWVGPLVPQNLPPVPPIMIWP